MCRFTSASARNRSHELVTHAVEDDGERRSQDEKLLITRPSPFIKQRAHFDRFHQHVLSVLSWKRGDYSSGVGREKGIKTKLGTERIFAKRKSSLSPILFLSPDVMAVAAAGLEAV
jgi:hypothetical protein